MSQERLPTLEEAVAARELTRPFRERNYAVKRAANFSCQAVGCNQNRQVLVVETGDGLSARCRIHVGRLKIVPGQWNETERD